MNYCKHLGNKNEIYVVYQASTLNSSFSSFITFSCSNNMNIDKNFSTKKSKFLTALNYYVRDKVEVGQSRRFTKN